MENKNKAPWAKATKLALMPKLFYKPSNSYLFKGYDSSICIE